MQLPLASPFPRGKCKSAVSIYTSHTASPSPHRPATRPVQPNSTPQTTSHTKQRRPAPAKPIQRGTKMLSEIPDTKQRRARIKKNLPLPSSIAKQQGASPRSAPCKVSRHTDCLRHAKPATADYRIARQIRAWSAGQSACLRMLGIVATREEGVGTKGRQPVAWQSSGTNGQRHSTTTSKSDSCGKECREPPLSWGIGRELGG